MKELFTVAKFTMKDMLKRKSFIISNIIILLIIVLAFNIPNILNAINGDKEGEGKTKILISDESNIFEGTLENINNMELGYEAEIVNSNIEFDKIKEKIENEEIEEALIITRENEKIKMEYIVENMLFVRGNARKPYKCINIII